MAAPARRGLHVHIKYMFIVQRYALIPAPARKLFAPRAAVAEPHVYSRAIENRPHNRLANQRTRAADWSITPTTNSAIAKAATWDYLSALD
ncbi:MAG: hypothetical protein KGI99_20725 [Bradyrhizobium sp.]|uniref:hypothetical protein n=1 Tax=Bradyrhizobium sp. TaxID=376 RepID=UPI001C281D23|nr:hypothetical protein [Bradyrhizobium sp.]MBU6464811.1 hypothetical protein [Pseudomonadota bacterium]MDE2069546.1 hypothetical protein [Bradyrhizobium sp.]